MAGTSLLTLIDDIATLLDDVAIMTKVAAKKTAGLIGDDLAVNAEQVTGFSAQRELPVIFAVAKGAMINKVILIPAALLISAFLPWLLIPLLLLGGAFLAYEGAHKVHHKLFHKEEEAKEKNELREAVRDDEVDLVAFEKAKIKGAIRTDFILSAEIIVIALAAVAAETSDFVTQLGALIAISVIVVVGVYGLVAGIVKIDDLGLKLIERNNGKSRLGTFLVNASPKIMKGLGIFGTVAMFLVGGGIFSHNIGPIEHLFHEIALLAGPLEGIARYGLDGILGVIIGAIIVGIFSLGSRLKPAKPAEAA